MLIHRVIYVRLLNICITCLSNFVILLVSVLLYVKVDHFVVLCCGPVSVFSVCELDTFSYFIYVIFIVL